MIISIKTKVLIKFGTSEMMYVELRAKKAMKCVQSVDFRINAHTHN